MRRAAPLIERAHGAWTAAVDSYFEEALEKDLSPHGAVAKKLDGIARAAASGADGAGAAANDEKDAARLRAARKRTRVVAKLLRAQVRVLLTHFERELMVAAEEKADSAYTGGECAPGPEVAEEVLRVLQPIIEARAELRVRAAAGLIAEAASQLSMPTPTVRPGSLTRILSGFGSARESVASSRRRDSFGSLGREAIGTISRKMLARVQPSSDTRGLDAPRIFGDEMRTIIDALKTCVAPEKALESYVLRVGATLLRRAGCDRRLRTLHKRATMLSERLREAFPDGEGTGLVKKVHNYPHSGLHSLMKQK